MNRLSVVERTGAVDATLVDNTLEQMWHEDAASNRSEHFGELAELARQIRVHAAPLPEVDALAGQWRGVGVQIGGLRFVTALGEASELLALPTLAAIPGVQPWVLGVGNVRGRLLPVFDLTRFFGFAPTTPKRDWRVLIVDGVDCAFGLAVEQSFGIQQFANDAAGADDKMDFGEIEQFVEGVFKADGRAWHLLNLADLVRHPRFLSVALQ